MIMSPGTSSATAFSVLSFSLLGFPFCIIPNISPLRGKNRHADTCRIIYAAPAFAIYLLDHVPIPNVQVNLLNPTNDSIQFSVMSDIKVPDAVSVRFDPMQALFFRAETMDDPIPIATVDLPSLKFGANEKVSLVNQTLRLGDVDQFAALVEDVAYNPTFSVAGQTKTRVHFGTLGTTVDLLKVVSLPGVSFILLSWFQSKS